MKLRKVISGGQTGADKAGLIAATAIGLETGGTAPKGYRTEDGSDPTLFDYGLIESIQWSYPCRTRANVRDADATLWFGNIGSPGYHCTVNAAHDMEKPFIVNPDYHAMRMIADTYEVINVAGNRASKNPDVIRQVHRAFQALIDEE